MMVVLAMLAGCASAPVRNSAQNPVPFAGPTGLTASYASPDIILTWKNNATETGGNIVEFNMNPKDEFFMLDFTPADVTRFRHENVAPETSFNYRLHPFFGRVSELATITTGEVPEEGAPNSELEGPLPAEGPSTAVPAGQQSSIRTEATFTSATPAHLTAVQASPTSIDLRWEDRASDEDGYLLEISAGTPDDFKACALLPPDTTSFKKIFLEPETKCYFRVRAFFYGKPTDPVTVVTPPEKKTIGNSVASPGRG